MSTGESLGWGVLGGTARITRRGFLPGLRAARNGRLVAVGSRSRPHAAPAVTGEFVDQQQVVSYHEVLADRAVDAVYLALPNSMHHEWVMNALAAGKHVLCEKPLTLTSRAAAEISRTAAGAGLVVMEAFMYRFHPQYARVPWERMLEPIGELVAAEVHFSEPMTVAGDIREDRSLGGGALWDIGCYCLDLMCWRFGEAIAVHAFGTERNGCNWSGSVQIRFAAGQLVTCWWSFHGPQWQRATLVGDRGIVTLYDPFRPGDRTTTMVEVAGSKTPVIAVGDDCFRREIEHFGDVVRGRTTSAVPLTESERWIRLAERIDRCLLETAQPGPTTSS
ncbi:MAG: Gfo/Idh/MocA family protein [Labedaea sp.]